MFLYFLHLLLSRFGSKLTSLTLVFILMRQWPQQALSLSVVLFAVGAFCTIVFAPFYRAVIRRWPSPQMVFLYDVTIGGLVVLFILFHSSLWLCFGLYFLLEILWGLRGLYDRGYFFITTKGQPFEQKAFQLRGSLISFLSMFLPAIAAALIAWWGVPHALWGDTIASILAGSLWLFARERLYQRVQDRALVEGIREKNQEDAPLPPQTGFFSYLRRLPPQLLSLCIFSIVVRLITQFEDPLIFNYLRLERGFSESQIGWAFSFFSVGMTLGGWLFTYVPKWKSAILWFITADALFSLLLSLPIPFAFVTAAYTLQGVFVMFFGISFELVTQKAFDREEDLMSFFIAFRRTSSLVTLVSYSCGFVLTLILPSGAMMFRLMALLEVVVCWTVWAKLMGLRGKAAAEPSPVSEPLTDRGRTQEP